jgi:hypothetical protein
MAAMALSFMMMMMGGCPTEADPPGPPPELTGTIKIQSGNPLADVTGDTLTAVYSGTEQGLSYQWKKGETDYETGITCQAADPGATP